MTNKDDSVSVLFIKRVPTELKNRFHTFCINHKISMTDAILYLLENAESVLTDDTIRKLKNVSTN